MPLSATCAAALLLLLPLQGGDSRSYLPPGEPGYVYTVIEKAAPAGEPVSVLVQWGSWRQSGRFGGASGPQAGVVVRLRHARWDRFRLTLSTSGRIVYGPHQGAAPAQWSDSGFQRVIW
jgi:hypothetical protein